jgi:hypothetical protein
MEPQQHNHNLSPLARRFVDGTLRLAPACVIAGGSIGGRC